MSRSLHCLLFGLLTLITMSAAVARSQDASMAVLGKWKIVRALDTHTVSCSEESRDIDFLGKVIEYSQTSVFVLGRQYQVHRYLTSDVAFDDFIGVFGFDPRMIKLKHNPIRVVDVQLLNGNTEGAESATIIVKSSDELVLDWYCIYFLAKRVRGNAPTHHTQ